MHRFRLTFPILFLAVQLAGVSPLLAQSHDEKAIHALLDRAFQASNSVDPKVVKQTFAEVSGTGGPFFTPFAASLASAAELEAQASQFVAQLSARSFSPTSPPSLRVGKNIAWATYTWRNDLTFKDGSRRGFDGRSTATFVREGKNWKIAHLHISLPAALPLSGEALQAEAQAILQAERNAWEALKNKQPAVLADYFADDASYFDETQAYRVRGKAEILRGIESWLRQGSLRSYQMLDPQVQVLGDSALLTYYFTESGLSAGKEFSNAGKISLVLLKQGGAWRAMHAHRSVNR